MGGFRDKMTVDEAMAKTGTTSPSEALRAHKAAIGAKRARRTGYLPHVGAKQRAKALRKSNGSKA